MIHLHIPDYKTVTKADGSKFESFNIHINGIFHCSMRYSQLHRLHDHIEQEFGVPNLPPFPNKKLFSLNSKQLDDRRKELERYLQSIIRHPVTSPSSFLEQFFFDAQRATHPQPSISKLDISLLDGTKYAISTDPTENTSAVLQKFCKESGMSSALLPYFGLFIVRKSGGNEYSIVRWLQNFESPLLALLYIREHSAGSLKLVIRKACWDYEFESELFSDSVAVSILFAQATFDISVGWTPVSEECISKLSRLKEQGSPREFIRTCQVQRYYGAIHFEPCTADFPTEGTKVKAICSGKNLILIHVGTQAEAVETSFRITKVRGWRIINQKKGDYQFSFEYLIGPQDFQWITITSVQAMLFVQCLQSMVDELMRLRKQGHALISNFAGGASVTNGHSSSVDAEDHQQGPSTSGGISAGASAIKNPKNSYESFRDLSSGSSKKKSSISSSAIGASTPNEAFLNTIIGDDDL